MIIKRAFDVLLSGVGIFLLCPVIIVLCFFVKRNLGSPIFFNQIRPGKGGVPFRMIKFRTMRTATATDAKESDASRLTEFGSFLRSTSLDELPELWNVLKGDMSLVGPRPLLMEYLPLYSPEQARRHHLKPGITGFAQVNGRNSLSWEEKFELDVWYVDNHTIWLDIKILFLTVRKVFMRDGISAPGEATMPRFLGTQVGKKR